MNTEYISWSEVKDRARQTDLRIDDEREAGQVLAVERRQAYIRGHQLAEMRKAADLTQADVAKRLGVSQARISKIEHGDTSGIDLNLSEFS